MSHEPEMSSPRSHRSRWGSLVWLVAGFLLAWFVFADPLGLHLGARWPFGAGAPKTAAGSHDGESDLYTCGMHPQVIQEGPGYCPICAMDLVPLHVGDPGHDHRHDAGEGSPETAAEVTDWVCADFPQVRFPQAGECPVDGTALVPLRAAAPDAQAAALEGASDGSGERRVLFYRNPMDPTITSPVPAKDSMGMDYVPVYAEEAAGSSGASPGQGPVVAIDPTVVQRMNVLTAPVVRRDIERQIRTVGYLDYDQQKMVTVTTKYSGFVERVYVNYVGEPVREGQALFEIYSPELVQTEEELLSALRYARGLSSGASPDAQQRAEDLVDAARARLSYWDVSRRQIEELETTGKVFRTLTLTSPSSGVVMMRRPGLEGMAVSPGMELFHVADLSSLWLAVEVFEDQLAWLQEGSIAQVELSYLPEKSFRGRVRFIEPAVDERTRTVSLRLEVPNREGRLRAGMYATVTFEPVAARGVLAVPREAVIRTGKREVAVVALGEGRFAPRDLELGAEGEDFVEVLSGLGEGEEVVTSSQFLIDSESNIREAIRQMVAERSARDGGRRGGLGKGR